MFIECGGHDKAEFHWHFSTQWELDVKDVVAMHKVAAGLLDARADTLTLN